MRKSVMIVIALIVILGSLDPAAGGEPFRFTASIGAAIDHIPTMVAKEKGIFQKHGLDLQLGPPMATGIDTVAAIHSGQVITGGIGIGPLLSALGRGIDLKIIVMQRSAAYARYVDDDQAIVARKDSGIQSGQVADLRGKRIGVPVGTTAHQYLLAALKANGLSERDVSVVNMIGDDMAAALQGGAVEAISIWEPVPSLVLAHVGGSYLVKRGGGYTPPYSFQIAPQAFIEKNPEIIKRFVAAFCEAQAWARKNQEEAAEVATRWLRGLDKPVAIKAMAALRPLQDPRISKYNYSGLNETQDFLIGLGRLPSKQDLSKVWEPRFIKAVMAEYPEFFTDLPAIPAEARVD